MAKTGHPNFDYTCQGYWRGAVHRFSIVGNHSGTSFGQVDAQQFMESDTSPFALCFGPLMATDLSVVASRYYDGQNSAPVFVNDYNTGNPAPTPLVPTAAGFSGSELAQYYPLEVCTDIYSEVGLGKTSKPVYNRKYLRGVPEGGLEFDSHGEATMAINSTGTAAITAMGDGSWYGSRVYISPNARSANNWVASTWPGNHQIPRGRKRTTAKASASALSVAEKTIETLLGLDVAAG
jgi:hypothetical protein